ncbi:unnamed protein product [Linum trigynum]|uniref:Uncharacterized protein n=1 Tax=Linum trigynum TaxID=586398 RepID=A0AAV2DTY2_9ROSI
MNAVGKSSKPAAVTKKTPAAETDKNWKGKNLYLKYKYGSWIWGFKAFEDKPAVVRELDGHEVLAPKVVCEQNFLDVDRGFPIGNAFFKFNGKAYLVGGETAGGKPWGKGIWGLPYQLLKSSKKSSDKFYEFNPDTNTLHQLDDLPLPLPMPSPIVAEIKGNVYVLYGDHCCLRRNGSPEDPRNCFQVLALDEDGNPSWKSLPVPPFYDEGTCSHYFKNVVGVVGHKQYVGVGSKVYAFDVDSVEWKQDILPFPSDAKTLSSRLMKEGNEGEKHCCFVVVYAEITAANLNRVGLYVALVHCEDGRLLHEQRIPEALPFNKPCTLGDYQVVELEQDGGAAAAGHLCSSNPFCFVYTTGDGGLVGLSVLRISLAAAPPDVEEGTMHSFRWGADLHVLKFEIPEKRLYEKPKLVNDLYTGSFDAVFLEAAG